METRSKSLLSAEGIRKSFLFRGSVSTVLDNVNFSIEEGEFVSIIGPSGCGKSTFLELLAGITLPDKGVIRSYGADITGKTGILGYMPQDDLLFPWLNTLQNILLPVKVKGRNTSQATKQIEALLPLFGLQNHIGYHPHQLSGGLKQRVALLRTYMNSTKVLLLDEPLANLDSLTRSQLQTWLKTIVETLKLTVILVTHDIDEAILLSNRIELMSKNPGNFTRSIKVPVQTALEDSLQIELKNIIKAEFLEL
ncbi:MAG: ABC transporter ATP-binding protein [Candidatus Cloacimonetes bacterium]|nr:ABC transporter ATP-binding protein [Candidatus Cloacimonadota bacterium]